VIQQEVIVPVKLSVGSETNSQYVHRQITSMYDYVLRKRLRSKRIFITYKAHKPSGQVTVFFHQIWNGIFDCQFVTRQTSKLTGVTNLYILGRCMES
jgi:hypothetical protein